MGVTALSCDTVAHGDVAGSAPGPGSRIALPGGGVLNRLPGQGDLLAWTVDDGADSEVVRLYTQFAKDTGMRLTYFITGSLHSWTDNADLLRPLVESGQAEAGVSAELVADLLGRLGKGGGH